MSYTKIGKRKQKSEFIEPGQLGGEGFHAYIATPAYDGRCYTDYTISLADTCRIATALGVNITAAVMGNGAFIDLARNNFVKMFLETECTHLFFIDSDLQWEPRAFIALMQANLPISAGAYRRREAVEDYPVKLAEDEGGGIVVRDGWILCERVPAGFLCIRRDVIEAMCEQAPLIDVAKNGKMPRLFYTEVRENEKGEKHFIGEDFAFCDDYCKQFGDVIPVWPDFDFEHAGYKCNYHKFLNRLVEAEEAGKIVEKSDEFTVSVDGKTLRDGTDG